MNPPVGSPGSERGSLSHLLQVALLVGCGAEAQTGTQTPTSKSMLSTTLLHLQVAPSKSKFKTDLRLQMGTPHRLPDSLWPSPGGA